MITSHTDSDDACSFCPSARNDLRKPLHRGWLTGGAGARFQNYGSFPWFQKNSSQPPSSKMRSPSGFWGISSVLKSDLAFTFAASRSSNRLQQIRTEYYRVTPVDSCS